MEQRTITLALKLIDEERKKIHGVIEKSINVTEDEEKEENIRPVSEFMEDIIKDVNDVCEKQGIRALDVESLYQELLIALLVSVAKEDTNEISIDVPVEEVAIESNETSPESEES